MNKNAFALIHFGSNPKYLELEIYFLKNLRKNTTQDIVYLYSVADTPTIFPKIIRPFVNDVVPFDDRGITIDIKDSEFVSKYAHFNTLRTCDFMFAYLLEQYEKVCIIESDMVIVQNIDSVFELNTPSILMYGKNELVNKNLKIHKNKNMTIQSCDKGSQVNGGLILFQPSLTKFQEYVQSIKKVIQNNCSYPNEALFLYVNPDFYNLPMRYNFSHYHFKKYKLNTPIYVCHFNESVYKPVDYIRDNYIQELNEKPEKKEFVLYFKKHYYEPLHEDVDKVMKLTREYLEKNIRE